MVDLTNGTWCSSILVHRNSALFIHVLIQWKWLAYNLLFLWSGNCIESVWEGVDFPHSSTYTLTLLCFVFATRTILVPLQCFGDCWAVLHIAASVLSLLTYPPMVWRLRVSKAERKHSWSSWPKLTREVLLTRGHCAQHETLRERRSGVGTC